MDKLHKKIVEGFNRDDISPAAMAYKMKRESKYVNETMLQYFINYIVVMATTDVIPFHLKEIQNDCRVLYCSLQELGLTGTIGRESLDTGEYLAV